MVPNGIFLVSFKISSAHSCSGVTSTRHHSYCNIYLILLYVIINKLINLHQEFMLHNFWYHYPLRVALPFPPFITFAVISHFFDWLRWWYSNHSWKSWFLITLCGLFPIFLSKVFIEDLNENGVFLLKGDLQRQKSYKKRGKEMQRGILWGINTEVLRWIIWMQGYSWERTTTSPLLKT